MEKDFSITGDALQLFGKRKKLIMKYKLSKNGTFKCNIQTTKEVFLTSNDEPEWLWPIRYGHLNFRSLSELNSKNLVHGLPKMSARSMTCEVCMRSKHNRTTFSSKTPNISRDSLEVVHFDIYLTFLKCYH